MSEDVSFRDLIRRVRAGDQQAATELVRQYESTVRLVVRRRLSDPAMRRLLDSVDICQSVLASFFVRVASGQYELEKPQQLLKLLATMARNKVVTQINKQRAARRDLHRLEEGSAIPEAFVDPHDSPSEAVAGQELLEEFRRRLTVEERQIAEQRTLGCSWIDIAAKAGGTPDAIRLRLNRAIDRIARELGLEE
jgi:RNA polymerase sigma factor (sigma-70 family)